MKAPGITALMVVVVLISSATTIPIGAETPDVKRNTLTWGQGAQGQLGDGALITTGYRRDRPVEAGTLDADAVASGTFHNLAIDHDGNVWAWGRGSSGQLGLSSSQANSPVRVPGLSNVVAVSGGYGHSLALKSDGTVWAWGANDFGQLGNGSTSGSNLPFKVPGLSDVVAIAAGLYHSLATKSDGSVWAWGLGTTGALGTGEFANSSVPVLSTLSGAIAVTAGSLHSAAVKSDGTVWAWGEGSLGQLGDGRGLDSALPVQVFGLTDVVSMDGGGYHTLALGSDGAVWAWGYGVLGQLGTSCTSNRYAPVKSWEGLRAVSISAGGNHSLAIGLDGSVWSWGLASSGQLGRDPLSDCAPGQVPGVGNAAAIAAGDAHSVALGLLPSGGCYEGTQVIEGTVASVQERIYVHVIDESELWICVRISAARRLDSIREQQTGQTVEPPQPTFGGKFIFSELSIPDPTGAVTLVSGDVCPIWIFDHSTLNNRVAVKANTSPPTVCVLAGGSWIGIEVRAPALASIPVDFSRDP